MNSNLEIFSKQLEIAKQRSLIDNYKFYSDRFGRQTLSICLRRTPATPEKLKQLKTLFTETYKCKTFVFESLNAINVYM